MQEVGWLHHPQFAASACQSPQGFYYLWLLPLKETGAKYGETEIFALLDDSDQFGSTFCTGTGWYVPCDVISLGGVREHLERWEWRIRSTQRRKQTHSESIHHLLKEGFFSMSCGMFILHITFQRLCIASCCIHSETQQGFVPPWWVLHIPELKLEVERAHLFPGGEMTWYF